MSDSAHNAAPIRINAGLGYSPEYLARRFRISRPQARELIRKVGHDREKLCEAAERLKGS